MNCTGGFHQPSSDTWSVISSAAPHGASTCEGVAWSHGVLWCTRQAYTPRGVNSCPADALCNVV
eukprot:1792388-Alexandrium_andersonii.AAC.1